ncbi:FecR family protein [Microscilla marina]|uniref:Sigma factor regulatory protein, FecR/PupR family n=1 Tax=Microscilla marina ATCC 23134 TaxID=313606 RepID=A1ZD63_MICM2|nr:FecR domain-containing protein [Microscilla marina]EAY31602.1 sigma factor regulatory protein, FecR/PupR family [Microscilla marina ATCC 23134]
MDKYHDFNVEDFAEDPQFYAWVTNPDPKSNDFWNQWIEKHPDKYAVITEARALLGALDIVEEDVPTERIHSLWNKIDAGIEALDKYKQYTTAEDFADDPSFFAWVTEPNKEADQHWKAWLEQNPTKHALVKKAKSLIGMLQLTEEEIPQSKIDDLWNRIDSRIDNLWNNIESGMEAIDQYADFTAEDFANDPSFFAWVNEPDAKADQYWNTWMRQHPEKAGLVEEAKKLIGLIQVKEEEIPQHKIDDLWNRIDSRIGSLWNNIESGMEAIDQYADFTAEDFANDPSFFAWVNEPDAKTDQHWNTWLEQHPEKKGLIEEAKKLIGLIQVKEEEIPQHKIDDLWNRIDSRIGNLWNNIESGIEAIDQYANFTAEDFANDPSFFVWVTEPDEETTQHWNTWLEQNPEKEEVIDQAKALIKGTEKTEVSQTRIDHLWQKINQDIQQTQGATTRSISMRKVYAAAASVIILLGTFFIFRSMTSSTPLTVASTQLGEQKSIALPDGSMATLNADSRIIYQTDNWDQNRNVELNGEAFFQVKKGSEFQVNTAVGKVEVLGTSFNVYTRQKDFKVECMTGKVKLTTATRNASLVLTPGMGSKLEGEKLKPYQFDKTNASNWRTGDFQYQETPLKQVFDELARQFNVKIEYKTDVKNRLYTGFFSNKDLASALKFICDPMSLKYTIKNDSTKTVVIQ